MTDWTSKENVSTLATWVGIALLPIIIRLGINIDQATLTAIVSTIIVIGIAVYSSLNPNKIDELGNNVEPVTDDYDNVTGDCEDGC